MVNVDWSQAWSIVGRGIGLVFLIMCLLAAVTSLMGRIIQRFEAKKKTAAEAEGGDK